MKIGVISGSQRINSQSRKVANYLQHVLLNQEDQQVYLLDLGEEKIPFVDEAFLDDKVKWHKNWSKITQEINSCDGLIIISPEWSGMSSPAVHNFLIASSYKDLAHKPTLLVGVSASRGGAYPIAELRSFGYKNTRLALLPEHLIIRDVEKVLNDFELETGDKSDNYIKERIDYTLRLLIHYSKHFIELRKSDLILQKPYPNGM